MIRNRQRETFTEVAYAGEYNDQAHFITDFKEFTATSPAKFLGAESMRLSSVTYKYP